MVAASTATAPALIGRGDDLAALLGKLGAANRSTAAALAHRAGFAPEGD
jgi:hypothetical protein